MNKVYKCIWNASLGAWVAVSELASSKKKTKSSTSFRAQGENSKSIMKNTSLIAAIACIGLFSTSAYSVAVQGEDTGSTGNLGIDNIDFWKLLTKGRYNSKINGNVYTTGGAIQFGAGATANNGGLAIGTNATALFADELAGATSVGSSAYSQGGGTAIGSIAAAGSSAVSVGRNAVSTTNAVAVGRGAAATGEGSMAMGRSASATAVSSVAIGQNSTATTANTVSFGNANLQRKLTNVANGQVSSTSVDAINGSQLYSANTKVAEALGGGSSVDANGNIIAPTYTVDGKKVNNVGDAITNVDGRVTSNSTDIAANSNNITSNTNNIASNSNSIADHGKSISENSSNIAANTKTITENSNSITDNSNNITDLNKTLSDGVFSVSANGKEATKVGKDAVIDYSNQDGNINISQNGSNFVFGLSDQLNIKTSVTVGNSSLSNNGLVISGGPSVTATGIDAGNATLTNLKDGVNANDAVTKGQLDQGLKDVGLIGADGKAIDAVTYNEDGNVVLKANAGKGSLISNVAAGEVTADSTDAINGSQLYSANTKVAEALGGGSTVDANGNIIAPTYTVDGKKVNNVGDAITNVDGRVTSNSKSIADHGKSISENSSNIAANTKTITENSNSITDNSNNITDLNKTLSDGVFSVSANGKEATKVGKDAVIDYSNQDGNINISQNGSNFVFGLSDQLNIKTSVTVGNSSLSNNGLVISGGPSVTATGIDAGNTTLTNLKDGVNANDAVTKGQLDQGLKDVGLIGADGKAIDAVTYNEDGNVVLKANAGKGSLISNVAAGKVTADSTDAINGSQLYSANTKVAEALGGGSTVDANGNITAPTYTVDGKKVNNLGDAITNVDSRVTNNSNTIASNSKSIADNSKSIAENTSSITDLSKTLSDGAFSVSANGKDASKVAKDAVIDFANTDKNINVSKKDNSLSFDLADQLNIKTSVTVGYSSLSNNGLVISGGPSVTTTGIDAGNTTLTNLKDGVNANDAVTKGQLDQGLKDVGLIGADGKAIDAVTYNEDGNVVLKANAGKGSLISNVAAGKVTADSTDAINGSQLYSANSKVAEALGGGSTVDANGNITAPTYNVDGKQFTNVGDAIINVDSRVTTNSTNISSNSKSIADHSKSIANNSKSIEENSNTIAENTNNITNISSTLTDGAFSVSANGQEATKVGKDAVIDYSNQDGNINISQNGSNFVFGLSDQLNIKTSVTVGNSSLSNNGLMISGGPSVTATGIDAGNTTISNVKDGVNANDAVTKGQLDRSLQEAGLIDANGKAVDTVVYTPEGDLVLKDNHGEGTTLSNVAAGNVTADSKDAVNGGQLYDTTNSVANVIGGNTVVNSDGTITTTDIGGTGKDNINDAILAINNQVSSSKNTVSAGKNVTVSATTNADGSQDFAVATADDLDLNSVTAQDINATNVTAENITAKNVNVGNVKIDGTSNKVSGVANGTVSETSTDVVTGSQLHTTNSNVANYLGGGSSLNSDGSVSAPNYNVAGGSYHNVGDALTAVDSRVNNLEQAFYETNRSINDLKQNANAGIAGAMAVGNLPQPTEAGMSMVSAGASGYSGQSAIAIGVSGITDSNKIIWKMGGTADSKSNVGGAISVGYQWK